MLGSWDYRMETNVLRSQIIIVQLPSDQELVAPEDSNLTKVMEETWSFLVNKCTQGVPSDIRKRTRSRYIPSSNGSSYKDPTVRPLHESGGFIRGKDI